MAGQVRLLLQNKFKIKARHESGSIPGLVQQLFVSGRVNIFDGKGEVRGIEISMLLAPFIILLVALGFAWFVFVSEFAFHKLIAALNWKIYSSMKSMIEFYVHIYLT